MWSASTVPHRRLVAKGIEKQMGACLKNAENMLDAAPGSTKIPLSFDITALPRETNGRRQGKVDLGG